MCSRIKPHCWQDSFPVTSAQVARERRQPISALKAHCWYALISLTTSMGSQEDTDAEHGAKDVLYTYCISHMLYLPAIHIVYILCFPAMSQHLHIIWKTYMLPSKHHMSIVFKQHFRKNLLIANPEFKQHFAGRILGRPWGNSWLHETRVYAQTVHLNFTTSDMLVYGLKYTLVAVGFVSGFCLSGLCMVQLTCYHTVRLLMASVCKLMHLWCLERQCRAPAGCYSSKAA